LFTIITATAPKFWACKALKPILNKIAEEYQQSIHLIEIDIEEDPEIAQMGQIIGTPTVQFFLNQELLREVKGVKGSKEFKETIEALLS